MDAKVKDRRERARNRRRRHIRLKVIGTVERPRLAVFRSTTQIYCQVIDDSTGRTLCAVSTMTPGIKDELKGMKKSQASEVIGKKIAELAKTKGIVKVVFDRAGYPYHGRVAALAKGAREGGLSF